VKVAVVGVGLIGGSIGLAAQERLGAHVSGYDPAAAAREAAIAHGAVAEAFGSLAPALDGADFVFVATPVQALAAAVREVVAVAGDGCVISDVGSVKRAVVGAVDDERFIGGHPLAGAETAGVEHARADLFQDATWYLTPTPTTRGTAYERLHRLITGIGAWPSAIEADTHDVVMASVSHLPHVLANVLVAQAARVLSAEGERLPATGPSFRDATRVAGANPPLWAQIYAANRDALAEQIDGVIARLLDVRERLDDLGAWQATALEQRRALLDVGLVGGRTQELRVSVPNRPGVIADLALTLGRAGINISDMSLAPSADNRTGEVALWVAADDAPRAAELIAEKGLHVS
jgi:prephenate dehydrogenase